MEQKKLDSRFIQLRQQFHQLQTSVRFSTSNRPGDIFTYHLKCYEIIGQLQELFVNEKVEYLFQFIQSIFSLMFSMLRQLRPKQQKLKQKQKADFGVQVQIAKHNKDQQKINLQEYTKPKKIKKRNFMQINVQDKQVSQMNFRERRRLLQAMRDSIEQEFNYQEGYSLSFFKPQNTNYNFSGVDQTIKTAIQKFKQSDISTHIFLKHYMQELSETDLNDIKDYSQILSKQNIDKIAKFTFSYKQKKRNQKAKMMIKSQTIKQTIHPEKVNNKFRHSLSSLNSLAQIEEHPQRKKNHSVKKMRFPSVFNSLIQQENSSTHKNIKQSETKESKLSQNSIKNKSQKPNSLNKLKKLISIENQYFEGKTFKKEKRQSFLKNPSTANSSVQLKSSILKKTTFNKKQLNSKLQRYSRSSFIQ